jgi:hypothetical protein
MTYRINGYVPNFKGLPLHLLSSGDYLVDGFMLKDGKEMVHLEAYGALINI